ncbi:hypothetical protein HNQ88_004596 [Aureibacter tunicatorum]|uniref:Uncharacterized protein n=1 Tax=Aureibacter tunicatorum TaxID=866807 RepID=A0AAE4BSS4_9BACT|nr:hypothetical protein [Aureibacter tunicatorum]BDD07033.1 hypothetical protein AUTU_45160 [Aureibacter tunicatorum]
MSFSKNIQLNNLIKVSVRFRHFESIVLVENSDRSYVR